MKTKQNLGTEPLLIYKAGAVWELIEISHTKANGGTLSVTYTHKLSVKLTNHLAAAADPTIPDYYNTMHM